MMRFRLSCLMTLFVMFVGTALAQLPVPSGPFGIGRVAYHWVDSSRPEPLSEQAGAHREIMVYVWYPADPKSTGQTVPYLPYLSTIKGTSSEQLIKSVLGSAFVSAGDLRTHTIENAHAATSTAKYPVLVFSHALGPSSLNYTMQMEDLASNGYVIAAVDHTYDALLTMFPDGRTVPVTEQKWRAAQATPGGTTTYEKQRLEVWSADIRFVIDELGRYDSSTTLAAPFAGRLDMQKIGAFGHSMGARAAARACQLDSRIRACANQEGVANGLPFYPAQDGRLLKQPFLLLMRPWEIAFPIPSDEQLAQAKVTREQLEQFNQRIREWRAAQDEMMHQLDGGSYRVTVNMPTLTHMGFSDLPFLQAAADGKSLADNLDAIRIINSATRAFFDRVLNENRHTLLDEKTSADSRLKIEVLHSIPTN
jgi:predicted dienelactone hydrolase